MIETGNPAWRGARAAGDGVWFSLWSSGAEAVELCLFDEAGRQTGSHRLPGHDGGAWHGFLPGCRPGQRYGYRVHGPWDPARGLRFNPNKLLIDPWARELSGGFRHAPAMFDLDPEAGEGEWRMSMLDSADCVPKSVVPGPSKNAATPGPRIPWTETVIYEAHVRGFTMRHPEVPEAERGRFSGMANAAILAYLRALGITSIELMPVHAFVDEPFLARRGLRNFWGYNSVNFFTPAGRYAAQDAVTEFREMVHKIHDAGFEVILDVVYNHTGEGDERGPTLSFRGIDNLAYYRTLPDDPGAYINDSGCGNSLNVDHPEVRDLVLASLGYWHREMGVDGFRFDLAPALGRSADGFRPNHELIRRIGQDRLLSSAKLIAEPWDPGPSGYQLGGFPAGWSEWNDRYRDGTRRFWRGDPGMAGEMARRLHGSSELFGKAGRGPCASINYITCHDGFTLADLVSYRRRHNHANGEGNADGHRRNFSSNYGAEGPTTDAAIGRLRRRQRLNMLATLLLSQGTPMLLAGDEFGNSQQGNNNAYAQDNETGWLDWEGLAADPQFTGQVRRLIRLRRETPLLRQERFPEEPWRSGDGSPFIEWRHPCGGIMRSGDWEGARAFSVILGDPGAEPRGSALAILLNASASEQAFRLPQPNHGRRWRPVFTTSDDPPEETENGAWRLQDHSLTCLKAAS